MQVLKTTVRHEKERIQQQFDGTIASACESSIPLDDFIKMTQIAVASDPAAARFIDAWNALSPSEKQARGAADALCKELGIVPLELMRIVAEAGYRSATSRAQITAAAALPSVLEKTLDLALNSGNEKTRLRAQTLLHKAAGFLPTPNSHTTTAITNTTSTTDSGTPPRPEDTIKRLSQRFNAMRSSAPPTLAASSTGSVAGGYAVTNGLTAPRRVAQPEYESKDEDDDV